MNEGLKGVFALLTLVVVAMIVIAMLRNPGGTKAIGGATFGQFNETLNTLARATGGGTPGAH